MSFVIVADYISLIDKSKITKFFPSGDARRPQIFNSIDEAHTYLTEFFAVKNDMADLIKFDCNTESCVISSIRVQELVESENISTVVIEAQEKIKTNILHKFVKALKLNIGIDLIAAKMFTEEQIKFVSDIIMEIDARHVFENAPYTNLMYFLNCKSKRWKKKLARKIEKRLQKM